MRLGPLINVLKAVPAFDGRVLAATDLITAVNAVKTMPSPSCVLYGVTESRDAAQYGSHLVNIQISLLIVCRNAGDMRGAAAYEVLDEIKYQSKLQLEGAIPDEGCTGLVHVGGRFAYAEAGTLVWQDDYSTQFAFKRI